MIDIQRSHDSPPANRSQITVILRYLPVSSSQEKNKCDVFYIINMAESEAQEVGLSLGGYDEEFINAVEDEDPMLTKCGHRCCKKCLHEHFKR